MTVFGDLGAKAVSTDFDYLPKISLGKENQNTVLGAPFNKLLWKPLTNGVFKIKLIPDELRSPIQSEVETLFLSGNVDFSTPAESAKDFLPYFKNGKQIILSEYGHVGDIRYLNQWMAERIITDYFNTGIIDTSRIKYVPMDFKVSWGFPKIAKAAIGIITILVISLLALIVWLVIKIKYKRLKKSLMINESA